MEHRRLGARPPLQGFIAHFWWVKWDLPAGQEHVVETIPHPTIHLLFEGEKVEIVGPMSQKFVKRLSGVGRVFGIKFRPAAFYSWWGQSVGLLQDQRRELRELFGEEAGPLAERLREASTFEQSVSEMEVFMEGRLPPLSEEVGEMRDLVERMQSDSSIVGAQQTAELVGLSLRTLQRHFQRIVGLSPKVVIRRFRLQEAAAQLASENPPSLGALAARLGYSDQAHFTKDFRLVMLAPPGAYLSPTSD